MTIEMIKFVGGYIAEGAASYLKTSRGSEAAAVSSEDAKDPVPYPKLIESITTCASIAMLGMMDPATKIGIQANKIEFYPPGTTQCVWRSWHGVGKQDFRRYQILYKAITVPQTWHEIGSDAAKAIARIQRIALIGLEMLKKTYEEEFITYYFDTIIPQCVTFYEANFPEEAENDTLIQRFRAIHPNAGSSNAPGTPTLRRVASESEATIEETGSGNTSETSTPSAAASSSEGTIEKEDYAKAKEINIFQIMKKLWTPSELNNFAGYLEDAYEHFTSNDPDIKNQISEDLKGIQDKINGKVKAFQAKLQKDQETRYTPEKNI